MPSTAATEVSTRELAADFLALGFCRLQIELLTRQMRYSVNIDETHFQNEAVAAARAAVAGDDGIGSRTSAAVLRHALRSPQSLLSGRRLPARRDAAGRYDARRIARRRNWSRAHAYEPAAHVGPARKLADRAPRTWQALLHAIDTWQGLRPGRRRCGTRAAAAADRNGAGHLVAGSDQVRSSAGPRARWSTAGAARDCGRYCRNCWPSWATRARCTSRSTTAAFRSARKAKRAGRGIETSVIDIFARVPADAAKPETFLSLSRLLVRFDGHRPRGHRRLCPLARRHQPLVRRPAADRRLSPVLGKFTLLDDYFMHTDMPGRLSKFEADDYRTPYLKQAIIRRQADPISSFVGEHREQAEQDVLAAAVDGLRLLVASAMTPNPGGDCARRLAALLADGEGAAAPRGVWSSIPQLTARRIGVELPEFERLRQCGGAVVAAGHRRRSQICRGRRSVAWFCLDRAGGPAAADFDAHDRSPKTTLAQRILRSPHQQQDRRHPVALQLQPARQPAFAAARLPARPAGGQDAPYTTMRAERVEVTADCRRLWRDRQPRVLVDAAGPPLGSLSANDRRLGRQPR